MVGPQGLEPRTFCMCAPSNALPTELGSHANRRPRRKRAATYRPIAAAIGPLLDDDEALLGIPVQIGAGDTRFQGFLDGHAVLHLGEAGGGT